MLDKTHKQLKLIYWSCVIIMLVAFVLNILYTSKYTQPIKNTGLEQWGIIITLAGIFASLKLLHPRLKDSDRRDTEKALRKYFGKFILRLAALMSVSVFNLICLGTTAIENFRYLAFISVFALFLSIPNKEQIEDQTSISDSKDADIDLD